MTEQTIAIIKPDAVRQKQVGEIIGDIEHTNCLKIQKLRWLTMDLDAAARFYAEHQGKPHYDGLVAHTASGPCVALVLEGPDAIATWRRLMGPTNPNQEGANGLRAKYGTGLPTNALHGSDCWAAFIREHRQIFGSQEQRASTVVGFEPLVAGAKCPTKMTDGAAGYDLYALEGGAVYFGRVTKVRTGIALVLPEGMEAQVRPRSGLADRHGVTVVNSPGTVDSDYRGEVSVLLTKVTTEEEGISGFKFQAGDRIAQLVFAKHESPSMVETTVIDDTARGAGGFGHTG